MEYKDKTFKADDLKGQGFVDCQFISCKFVGSNLRFTSFNKCVFRACDLSSVIFDRCNLKEANLINTNISGASFTDCKIENTTLDLEGFITFGNSKGFVLEQFSSSSIINRKISL